jgi:hypothetical protein
MREENPDGVQRYGEKMVEEQDRIWRDSGSLTTFE